jgi:hypothetical protein
MRFPRAFAESRDETAEAMGERICYCDLHPLNFIG